jgi:hypothetical protein
MRKKKIKDMPMPRFIAEGWEYLDENEHWQLKPGAPTWAEEEFAAFHGLTQPFPNGDGTLSVA